MLLGEIALASAALARGLPAHTFYVGDPGVKLIAARNAIAHPSRPFEIPLPAIGGEVVPYADPFFTVHGDHSHAITPELFPLVSAPFIALFGLRGAYLLPAAGLLLALAATAWLAVLLDPRRNPAMVLVTTFLATPLLFYGLEFWEHALAAGIAAVAAALFVKNADVGPVLRPGDTVTDGAVPELELGPTFVSGVLFGIAALLRPEALWFAVAVLTCTRLLPSPPRVSGIAIAAAGIASAFAPLELYTLLHFGSLIPPHIAGNPAIVSGDWLAIRATVLSSWLGAGTSSFWRVAPAILLALVPVNFFSNGAGARLRSPLTRASYGGQAPGRRSATREGGSGEHGRRRFRHGRRFLIAVAIIDVALVVLTAPNDGGGQWGPRYLLLAYIPLAILTSDVVSWVVSGLSRTSVVGSGFSRILALALVACLALGSAWIQRSAYKELRGAKLTYARMVDFVARETPPGRYVVTDIWWLDQVAASLADSRQFLFAPSPAAASDALQRLSQAGEPAVTLIRSRVESSGAFEPWLEGTCYSALTKHENPEGVIAIQLARSATCRRQ